MNWTRLIQTHENAQTQIESTPEGLYYSAPKNCRCLKRQLPLASDWTRSLNCLQSELENLQPVLIRRTSLCQHYRLSYQSRPFSEPESTNGTLRA